MLFCGGWETKTSAQKCHNFYHASPTGVRVQQYRQNVMILSSWCSSSSPPPPPSRGGRTAQVESERESVVVVESESW